MARFKRLKIGKRISATLKFSRKYLLDDIAIIFACFLAAFLAHYIWVNNFSSACLRVELSNFRQEYLDYVFTSESIGTVLNNARADTDASVNQFYIYTNDYDYIAEYATSTTGDLRFEQNLALIPVSDDPFLESNYDDHRFQNCHYTSNGDITNTRFKSVIEESIIKRIVTCPVTDQNNFVIGFTTASYTEDNESTEITGTDEGFGFGTANYSTIEQKLKVYSRKISQLVSLNNSV